MLSCISFDSYIKPQPNTQRQYAVCVVYLLIPTSNHNLGYEVATQPSVVYLLIPTSNHNYANSLDVLFSVVYLLIPTSNHNFLSSVWLQPLLYIFWFLHQTTTPSTNKKASSCCISFDSYIKPQLNLFCNLLQLCCISFDSYIKPQLNNSSGLPYLVVYLLIPTSNHNAWVPPDEPNALYIFWFLHQTTTRLWLTHPASRCISFDSYIKPQPYS